MVNVSPTRSVSVINKRHRVPGEPSPPVLSHRRAVAHFLGVLPARARPIRGYRAHDQALSDWLDDSDDERRRQCTNTTKADTDSKSSTAFVAHCDIVS